MYLYFNKEGILETVIPHGETVRQGSYLNIYVLLDDDFFIDRGDDIGNYSVNVELAFPNNRVGTVKTQPVDEPALVPFQQLDDSEITYALVDGKEYWTYHFRFTPNQATLYAGKIFAMVSVMQTELSDPDNIESAYETDLLYYGKADIYVEKVFGIAKRMVDEAELHYKNLVVQLNNLNKNKMNKLFFTIAEDDNDEIKTIIFNVIKNGYLGNYVVNNKYMSYAWKKTDGSTSVQIQTLGTEEKIILYSGSATNSESFVIDNFTYKTTTIQGDIDLSPYLTKTVAGAIYVDISTFNNLENRVKIVENNYLDKTTAENDYAKKDSIPTKTSQLTNDSSFVNKSYVDNMQTHLMEVAEGKTKTYIAYNFASLRLTEIGGKEYTSSLNEIPTLNEGGSAFDNYVPIEEFKRGDIILIKEVDKPDLFVIGLINNELRLAELESRKIDLSSYATKTYVKEELNNIDLTPYLKKTEASNTYLGKQEAGSTFLTQNNAIMTYATKDELSNMQTNILEVAEGKSKSYVTSIEKMPNFSSTTAGTFQVNKNYLFDLNGAKIDGSKIKVGDIFYLTDSNVADKWVAAVESDVIVFLNLETTKVDLTSYLTKTAAESKYATKEYVEESLENIDTSELENQINDLKEDIGNIDNVLEQINGTGTGSGSSGGSSGSGVTKGEKIYSIGAFDSENGGYSCTIISGENIDLSTYDIVILELWWEGSIFPNKSTAFVISDLFGYVTLRFQELTGIVGFVDGLNLLSFSLSMDSEPSEAVGLDTSKNMKITGYKF